MISLMLSTPRSSISFTIPISRSEEHTSELQSHSFISYAVFCLKKKKQKLTHLCTSLRTHLEPPAGSDASREKECAVATVTSGLRRMVASCASSFCFFFLKTGRPPISPLFPNPPLSG